MPISTEQAQAMARDVLRTVGIDGERLVDALPWKEVA